MRANCWTGRNKVEVQDVPDPKILNARDAIVRITSTAICGSDLHLYNGFVPTMEKGDILGHEFMGEVVEVGRGRRPNLQRRRPGGRAVPDRLRRLRRLRSASCTRCCENSNPNAGMAEKLMGHSPAGIFGYSHMLGGFAGGQAEYVRVPFADVGPLKIEDDLTDEQVLFLSDILPTGYMGAEMCDIQPGDVVAVWGAGPVGQFAIASARLLGAERVIAIDRFRYRLRDGARQAGADDVINYEEVDVLDALQELTGGRGPGRLHRRGRPGGARHGARIYAYDRVKQAAAAGDRPAASRCARRSWPAATAASSR